MNNYNVGLYIRLSKEDSKSDDFSESVKNQKELLLKYVEDNNLNLYKTYIDDGFTGTNFDRPSFKEMIRDVNDGLVNMVVVKDLSRLGRDYVSVGYYIENWFPRNGVRFVSILDNIDSSKSIYGNEFAPFKSVINDMYSKDNSKKIKAALRIKQENGKWVGGCPPFGYMSDKNDKNHLVVNEKEKKIVQRIFSLFLSGYSINKIANSLSLKRIPTPSMLRRINRKCKYSNLGIWSSQTVKAILNNELYTGNLVQNRRQRISYKVRKIKKNSEDNWIIVKNTHEPIVSESDYLDVQRLLKKNGNIKSLNRNEYKLSGLIFCGECGGKLSIQKNGKYHYVVCNKYKRFSKMNICTSHSYNYESLECQIIKIIKNFIEKIDINSYYQECLKKSFDVEKINFKISQLQNDLDNIFFEKIHNEISRETYNRFKKMIIEEIKVLNEKTSRIESMRNYTCDDIFEDINRKVLFKLVRKISIHDNKKIDLFLNFKNTFLS